MMDDIYEYDNPIEESLPEPLPLRCHICAHDTCPVYESSDPVKDGLVKVDARGRFKNCLPFKPIALGLWNFLCRMGVCAMSILTLFTAFQVPLWTTVVFGCSAVTFWAAWEWLEEKKCV